jgi:hypothetical protein
MLVPLDQYKNALKFRLGNKNIDRFSNKKTLREICYLKNPVSKI